MTSSYVETREKRDWVIYVLLISAVMCLPQSIGAAEWFPESGRLFYTAFWGMLVGVVLARSPAPTWLSWWVGLSLGGEYALQFAGKLLPSLSMVLGDLGHTFAWLWELVVHRSVGSDLPFSRSIAFVLAQSETMIRNLSAWMEAVQGGMASQDNTVLSFAVSLVIWILAWNAGYELFRRRRTFVASLPLGIAVIANVSFSSIGMVYVHFFLAITLLTLVRANLERMEKFWARLGMDFSPELKRDATIAGAFLSAVVLVVGLVMPYMTYNRAVFFFWDRYGPKFMDFYEQLDLAFAGRNPVPEPTLGARGLTPHRISTGGIIGDDVVFIVETSDPVPLEDEILEMYGELGIEEFVPKHYWRERTYDIYTGHGWDSSERKTAELGANEPWREINFPHTVLTQTFHILNSSAGLAFAVNEPLKLEQDYRAFARGDADLAALSVDEDVYTVISLVPEPTEEELEAAEGDYPDWVEERFLSLPGDVPSRVRQAAQDIVQQAGAVTRYEKARAIEVYIRDFDYDLDLEPPPLDADVVDYFLFTAQRGYCDYSATAMVVMLRSVGVAARYASGFGMGDYDFDQEGWVVTAHNAHAWAEVYFPGYGWIEFEPTPTQRMFTYARSRFGSAGQLDLERRRGQQSVRIPLWAWAVGLVLVLLFVIIWPPRWFRRRPDPRQSIWRTYDKLVRRARWAGLAPYGGQTPREYLQALASEMQRRASFASGVTGDIGLIDRVYQRARYSDETITRQDSYQAEGAWRRLRGKLLRLAFVRGSSQPKIS